MYIRVVSLHSEASVCRERECVCVAVAGLQELAGADLGVVLCESDKGFKGL